LKNNLKHYYYYYGLLVKRNGQFSSDRKKAPPTATNPAAMNHTISYQLSVITAQPLGAMK
jgi:hypothetical protein